MALSPQNGLVQVKRAIGGAHDENALGALTSHAVELEEELGFEPPRGFVFLVRAGAENGVHLVWQIKALSLPYFQCLTMQEKGSQLGLGGYNATDEDGHF